MSEAPDDFTLDEQVQVPEGITRTVSPEEWSEVPDNLRSKLSEVINKKDSARKDESRRLHETIGELRGRLEAIEQRPAQDPPEASGGNGWGSLSDEQFFAQAANALDLGRQAILDPENAELKKAAAQVDGRVQLQIMEEWARRKASGSGDVAALREELQAERAKQQQESQMVNSLMAAGLPVEALRNPSHPVHAKKNELVEDYAAIGVTGEAAEYAAWREALATMNRGDGPSSGPRRLDVSSLPLSRKYEEDKEVSALRRKGDYGSLKEASSLKMAKFFLDSAHNQSRS